MPRMIRSSAEDSVTSNQRTEPSAVESDADAPERPSAVQVNRGTADTPPAVESSETLRHTSDEAPGVASDSGVKVHAPARRSTPDDLLPSATPLLDDVPVALAESMRYLVARFQLRDATEFPARLGVTSALHGEGVTTISRTLAAIVAHDLDRRVCWVDLTWPRSSKWVQESRDQPGLVDVLTGASTIDDALHVTEDPRLTILSSGLVPAGQRETFARSAALGEVLEDLSDRFDCLIMDSPPVLAGSASLAQLRHASAYILVVRHGVTSTQQIRAATDELTSIPSMGVVLNGYKSKIPKRLSHFFVA